MARKSKIDNDDSIGSFDEVFHEEDCSKEDEVPEGTTVATFSFSKPNNNTNTKINTNEANNPKIPDSKTASISPPIKDNRTNPFPKGATPPVNGETFDVKRTYMLRASTVKKLISLAAAHPNINVYISSIVDAAITHYHNYIFNEGGSQE